jgi:hypothetical protein
MKETQDYIRDIAEIRSMMERSSKFLSLSGWAGVLAGVYALSGAYVVYRFFHFNPSEISYSTNESGVPDLLNVVATAVVVLLLAVCSAIFLSKQKAVKSGETLWNVSTKHLLIDMATPLVAGGFFILVLMSKNLIGLLAPSTLVFYGIALYNAGRFTYKEIRSLGLIEIGLGLLSAYFVEYGLLCWAIGFGAFHIVYGVYMHYKYER